VELASMSTNLVDGPSSSEQKVGLLEPQQVFECWNGVLSALNKVPHFWDYYTPESLLTMAVKGKVQVWLIGDERDVELTVVTSVVEYPNIKVLWIMAASGEKIDVYSERLHDVFEGYAKLQGCSRIEIRGRGGWLKKFGKFRDPSYDYIVISRAVETRSVQ
jgi:hypothetical protein